MPWGLKRFQQARCLHFITFSCCHRTRLRHYLSGLEGVVEIESQWTVRERRQLGMVFAGNPFGRNTPALSLQKRERQGRATRRKE